MAAEETELPELQFSVACDGVAQDPGTGKLALVGVFEQILQPSVVPQFFVINRWTYGKGSFTEQVKITDGQGNVTAQSPATPFTLARESAVHTVISGFVNTSFAQARVYWIEVQLEGALQLAWPLPVLAGPG